MAELVPRISYDLERGQSWFVVLPESYFVDAIMVHETAFRSPFLDTFRYTHVALDEAGIQKLWQRQSGDVHCLWAWGVRSRGHMEDDKYLVFEDMLLAWVILVVGFGSPRCWCYIQVVMTI
ncbi:conserved hypothetical protein [Culex quinquefasciatus]|uniref:Uncharacterized protein n=1 Tax=Culex quinquefasciatus TaxID=7176 RepID=B0WJM8_CULQU|nr:conserved hypothetical protein [Culex quinquefasciatus]|eukprot:XP_001848912.1 conserved hypothetical protein [Culex quinquefasciatus]